MFVCVCLYKRKRSRGKEKKEGANPVHSTLYIQSIKTEGLLGRVRPMILIIVPKLVLKKEIVN